MSTNDRVGITCPDCNSSFGFILPANLPALTKREYFAAFALVGLVQNMPTDGGDDDHLIVAAEAVGVADAIVDEVQRDGGDLGVYLFRLDARTKDFARKAPAMSNTIADNHALPCPFCGQGPTTNSHELGEDDIKWWCDCSNAKCLVQPSAHGATESRAIAAWNKRAPVTP